ncbi:MAG: hypothetical protein MUF81_17765 [Verrucomicrobia bacterium]|nr:hypothetical protein [Verrucomicrobiota bacterium]
MKKLKPIAIILSVIIGMVAIGAVGLIVSSEYLNHRSKRKLTQLVSELKPGTSFGVVKLRLGEPSQTFTNSEELEMWGTTKDKAITTDCLLFKFMHRGIPYRWVLIYTDRNTNAVVYADWQDM